MNKKVFSFVLWNTAKYIGYGVVYCIRYTLRSPCIVGIIMGFVARRYILKCIAYKRIQQCIHLLFDELQ